MEFPRRILVGIDDEAARRLIVQIARGFKLDAIEATTGRQAYAALIVGDAVLGFLDLNIPDMDALDVVRRVHAANLQPRPKLIAISWMAPNEHAIYQAAGFDDHILKPLDPDHVTAILFKLQQEPR